MLLVNLTYATSNDGLDIMLSRSIHDNDDLRMVIGEVLYGVEVQCRTFDTDAIFKKYENKIPAVFKKNCTVIQEQIDENTVLTVTLTGKPVSKAASKKKTS